MATWCDYSSFHVLKDTQRRQIILFAVPFLSSHPVSALPHLMGAVATELAEAVHRQVGGTFLPSYLQASTFKYTHTKYRPRLTVYTTGIRN